jgi:type IV secretion system protein VirB8
MKREKGVKTEDLTKYFEESAGLERDYADEILRSRRAWQRIGLVGLVIGLLGIGAGLWASSKPAPAPVVVAVDHSTGRTDILTAVTQLQISDRIATDRSEVYRYVLDRESYDWNTIQTTYDNTGLKSSQTVADEYKTLFDGPRALDKTLGQTWRIVPKVVSIDIERQTQTGGNAFVRFTTQKRKDDGTLERPLPWVAAVAYEYSDAPMTADDRLKNHLGFLVTTYRRTAEIGGAR